MRSAWSPYSGIFHVVRDLLYLKFSIKTCFKCSNLWSLLNYLPHVLSRPTCSRALLSTVPHVPHAIRVVMPYLLRASHGSCLTCSCISRVLCLAFLVLRVPHAVRVLLLFIPHLLQVFLA